MTEIIIVGVLLIIGLSFLCFKKAKELSNHVELKKLIAWCVTTNSTTCRCNLALHEYVSNAQVELNILPEYCIIGGEWKTVNILIESFQKETTQRYFCNALCLPKSKYVIDGETFFMYLLQEYLGKHQCDDSFLGYDMHKETISRKNYGSWGGQIYDATYALTDFAVVFYKLYYIAYLSCKRNKKLNPSENYYNNEHAIEDIIDSRRISISQM